MRRRAFDQGRATRYQISITAKIELLDHRNDDKVLWKNDQYRFIENYEVNIANTDAFDQELHARARVTGSCSRRRCTSIAIAISCASCRARGRRQWTSG